MAPYFDYISDDDAMEQKSWEKAESMLQKTAVQLALKKSRLAAYDIDMMFAGHTHGRQVDISYFDDHILPAYGKKYIKGLYTFDSHRGTQLYVTGGLGTTKLPLRLGTPPEVNIINLI